jgi:hypothetical protein
VVEAAWLPSTGLAIGEMANLHSNSFATAFFESSTQFQSCKVDGRKDVQILQLFATGVAMLVPHMAQAKCRFQALVNDDNIRLS